MAEVAGSLRSALAHRDFRLLLSALSVSTLGDWLYNVGLQVFVFTQTHSAGWVAATTIFRLAPAVLLGAVGGAIADRFDRKRVLIASDLARAVLMGTLALVAFAASAPAAAIALAFASTLAGTPYLPAVAALTPSIVTERDLAAANAAIETVNSAAVVIGPALGGLLLAVGSPGAGFAINAGSFLLSAMAASRLRTRQQVTRSEDHRGPWHQISAGVRALRASGSAAVVILFYTCSGFTYGLGTVLFILVSEQLLGTGAQGYGYLLGALGLGSVLAIGFTNRLARSHSPVVPLTIGLALTGLPFAALAAVHHPAIAFALLLFMGAGGVVVDVLSVTFLQRSIETELLGRVFGLVSSIGVGVILLGALMAPLLVAALGLRLALVVGGLALPVLTLLLLPKTRRVRVLADARMRALAPRVERLSHVPIFKRAPREALELLAAELVEEDVDAGQVVVRQSDPADDFFVVVAGTLEVRFTAGDAEPAVVNTLGPGAYFGEIGLVEGIPRTATVVATSRCHLYRISGTAFLFALNSAPMMYGPLGESMAARLARTHPMHELTKTPLPGPA